MRRHRDLIDAGVAFPEPELLGVDLIIPDLRQLQQYKLSALVLTHGHEDHIGAVPHVLPYFEGPVFGTALTLAFVESKLEENDKAGRARLRRVRPRERVQVGCFTLEFLRVTHSIPDCVAVAIETPRGVIIHTGDFRSSDAARWRASDARFAELGAAGVLALLADSPTSIDEDRARRWTSPMIRGDLHQRRRKIVVAMFASSIIGCRSVDLAAQFDRRVAFIGRRDRQLGNRPALAT